jgi:rubrerythrin
MRLKYTFWGFTWFLIALIQMTWVEQLKIMAKALNYRIIGYIWQINYIMIITVFLLPVTLIADYFATKKEEEERRFRDEAIILIREIEELKKLVELRQPVKCSRCGAAVTLPGAKYCPNCGTPL